MKTKIFSIDDSLGFLLYRVHIQGAAALKRAFQASGSDLTPEQWSLMLRLSGHEGMNQSQLGETAYKDRHNTTRILNQLEKRGYIERRPDRDDRRAYNLFLTGAGRAVRKALAPVAVKHYERALKGLKGRDLQILRRLLVYILGNLESTLRRPEER
jgi:DNA-binding MarR family transcriptional regulator